MRSISGVEYDSVSNARSIAASTHVAALAEVHPSGKLAHDLDVQIAQPLRPQRRNPAQRLQHLHRPQIHIQAQPLAQAQQSRLRPLAHRKRIPLRPAHRAEKNRVGFAASIQRFVGQRIARLIDRRAANRHLHHVKLVLKFPRAFLQHARRRARHFRPDSIARQKHNFLFQLHREVLETSRTILSSG